MTSAPITPTLRDAAPDIARRFGVIMADLYALVAHGFLRHPTRVFIIIPLCGYITRTIRRFQRLAARVAAGDLPRPRPRPSAAGRATPSTRPRPAPLPSRHGWLGADLGYMARGYGSQLATLLAEPATIELLATVPSAGRLLRPICRMLGRPFPALRAPSPAKPAPAAPRAATPIARPALLAATACPPAPSLPPAGSRPSLPGPPCEHLRNRWPWRPWLTTGSD